MDSLLFTQLPERVNRFLLPAEPIVLHYTINPSIPPPDRPVAYDVEVQMDDINLKTRMQHVVVTMAPETIKELAKIDEEVRICIRTEAKFYRLIHRPLSDWHARSIPPKLTYETHIPAHFRR